MKKITLLLMLTHSVLISVLAQTNYGTSSGTLGINYSYFGYFAGNASTTSASNNSFFGTSSGQLTTTGNDNTAVGFNSLYANTIGYNNIAMGSNSMYSNTSGYNNTSLGVRALYNNTTANKNTAVGYDALYGNTTGQQNTAVGVSALQFNSNGWDNTAIGYQSLYSNSTGSRNTGVGDFALYYNTSGSYNAALGISSLTNNTTGEYNVGVGLYSLYTNTAGSYNSAVGTAAGGFPGSATAFSNTTALGAFSVITASNQVRVGDSNVTSIGGQVSWSTLSDGRFKRDIKDDVSGLDFVNQLRPVSYTVDKEEVIKFLGIPDTLKQNQPNGRKVPVRQTGFIAQEVEAVIKKSGYVFSGIETPENEKDPYTIRYAEFVVPLVKAVQELTGKVQEQQARIEEQQLQIVELRQQLGLSVNSGHEFNANAHVRLFQNSPNPFSLDTEIRMELPESIAQANLIIYNLEGEQLKDIHVKARGSATVKISGNELNAGIYLYALIADGKIVDMKRLVMTK